MKTKKTQSVDVDQISRGLAALGSAGAWDVALDETVEGAQRCNILMRGKSELTASLRIERSELQELTDALDPLRDKLSEDGVVT